MKRGFKIMLEVLGVIVFLALVIGIGGWIYIKNQFLNFEDDFEQNKHINNLIVEEYPFQDRNRNGKLDVYEDSREPLEKRVEDALRQMTMEEKIHLLKGSGLSSSVGMANNETSIPGAVGTIVSTPRLGLPEIYLSDGPAGLRIEPTRKGTDDTFYCTAFPIGTLLASTWNTDLVQEVGDAMGNEALEYGIDVILGPGANIQRHPLCGRNFEYYSEDPVLTGNIGAAMVNGIESNGVGSSVKHFVANNQETERVYNNAIVSERAMREIYLKDFEIIVIKSQPWTIMSSYNKVNGTYVSENKHLLTDILRNDWGYTGLVMSDWFGGKTAYKQISAGNDLLEPGTKDQWNELIEAQEEGKLTEEDINTSVRRILRLVFKSPKMKGYSRSNKPDLKSHAAITRQSAAEGMVLLKNQVALPLKDIHNVALLGVTSYNFIAGGSGSGKVNGEYTVSLEEGLVNKGFEINKASREVYLQHKQENKDAFNEDGGALSIFYSGTYPEIKYTSDDLEEIAEQSDVAIITIGRNAGEGKDRIEKGDFLLTKDESFMIEQAGKAFHSRNKKVIVVLNISGVIETSTWKSHPDAILLAWQGGQEGGNSVADILTGQVNPSGKLPMTFPVHLNDHASNANFPLEGKNFNMMDIFYRKEAKPEQKQIKNEDYTLYEEGIYVGYRHFDKANLSVSYPFGYGLSYTDFDCKNLKSERLNDTIQVSFTILNTGKVAGKEVAQIYVSVPHTKIDRPIQELKGFVKTDVLHAGDSVHMNVSIPLSDLRYWNEQEKKWTLEAGEYQVKCGFSSRDIRQTASVEIWNESYINKKIKIHHEKNRIYKRRWHTSSKI